MYAIEHRYNANGTMTGWRRIANSFSEHGKTFKEIHKAQRALESCQDWAKRHGVEGKDRAIDEALGYLEEICEA